MEKEDSFYFTLLTDPNCMTILIYLCFCSWSYIRGELELSLNIGWKGISATTLILFFHFNKIRIDICRFKKFNLWWGPFQARQGQNFIFLLQEGFESSLKSFFFLVCYVMLDLKVYLPLWQKWKFYFCNFM